MDILVIYASISPFKIQVIRQRVKRVKFQDYLGAIKIPLFNFPFLDPLLIYSKVYLTFRVKALVIWRIRKMGRLKKFQHYRSCQSWQIDSKLRILCHEPRSEMDSCQTKGRTQAIGRQISVQSKQNITKESLEGGINSVYGLFNSLVVSMEVILI